MENNNDVLENPSENENVNVNENVGDLPKDKEPSENPTRKHIVPKGIFASVIAVLLAVLITFMTTFTLLDRKYQKQYNTLLSMVSGDTYYTLDEVKRLFSEYYIGDVSELTDEEITDALIRTYIAKTGDDYAYYWNKDEYAAYVSELQGEGVGIGVYVSWLEEKKVINVLYVYDDSPAQKAGIEPGDLIVAVDGELISKIGYDNAVSKIKGEIGSDVTLTLLRNDEEKIITATRKEFTTVSVVSKMLADEKTGYIRILQFDGTTVEQFAKEYLELEGKGAEQFVFDVRDNPGGALDSVMGVLSFLVGDDVPLIEVSDKSGGIIIQNSSRNLYCKDEYSSSKKDKHEAKTVILVNENTASAGELFTAVLNQYYVTVGKLTYGKGVMQRTYQLPNGGALKLTFAKYTAPGTKNYDGVGINPDVEQSLSEEAAKKNLFALTEQEDDQLQAALEALSEEN